MKIGQVIFGAASTMLKALVFSFASAWVFEWLRTLKVSRVSSGSSSQIFSHSNGPDSAMQARIRFSYAAARGA